MKSSSPFVINFLKTSHINKSPGAYLAYLISESYPCSQEPFYLTHLSFRIADCLNSLGVIPVRCLKKRVKC